MPKATRAQQGSRNLLEICLSVHGCTSGSGEYYRLYAEDVELLQSALRNWEAGAPSTKGFDDAVRELIRATVAEVAAKEGR